jgi:GTP-binding protein
MFVDRVEIHVKAGDGGNGCVSFRKEKYVPRGGPNGGDGGNGGSVRIEAAGGLTNLAHLSFQRQWKAERGEHGQGSNCTGRSADDLVIAVPVGTVVRDRERGFVLRDLHRAGESVVVARGGKGGFGNAHFKSSTNRAPRTAEKGTPGEERSIGLELKVIADVGLIGLPNAGKSTLLARISRAQPEIADYPFTTKYPNLGTVSLDGEYAFVVADIPGLIEGAHLGHGLGHEFLRHVERTRLLVHLVDPLPSDGSDPLQNYQIIRAELAHYSAALATRPELVVVSKMDLTGADAVRDRLTAELGREVSGISAVSGRDIPALLRMMSERLATLETAEEQAERAASSAPAGDGSPSRKASLPPSPSPSPVPAASSSAAESRADEPVPA